jgi:hypothetical protein
VPVSGAQLEPFLVRELRELEERVDLETTSPLRVLARSIAYLCGLLLFLVFDEHNAHLFAVLIAAIT